MGNCSAKKNKDKDKASIENGNQCGSNEQRRVSNISVESVAYGRDLKQSTNNSENLNNDLRKTFETKTADSNKLVNDNATSHPSSSKFIKNSHDTQHHQQAHDNQQKQLNKCMSLNESTISSREMNSKHQTACPTNSNPNESSTPNRLVRNCYDAVFTLESNRSHIILISNDLNELVIFNLKANRNARILRNVNKPKHIELIDQFRAVVLCDRELNVYNLDEGRLVTKLKGVMNQKMAFYGLHDKNYAVTLSRNRMYVNMINLETGNLETTFKVGEDRFLNSLLVSKNGKICVCGDETQKPFPLLVWNLTSRKLIYDLRIPNHEFITAISAISNDGHFVVCVCKENTPNSTNFMVVYDLQSGTLFKKWKPEHNTVSITISSNDNCVVNGLENKQIQVWDLSTGAIRHVLDGHEKPVDKLKVADDGEYFLSYDSTLEDKNIRVWSLTKGTCIKTILPDFEISCCTLSSNGKLLILCPNDRADVKVIQLTEKNDEDDNDLIYGDPSRNGMEFDLSS